MFCSTCGLRWPANEDQSCVAAGKAPPVQDTATDKTLRMAKAIVGPYEAKHIGRDKLLRLRDHRWAQLSRQEQAEALACAQSALAEREYL